MGAIFAGALKFLTSPIAGPIFAGVAALLLFTMIGTAITSRATIAELRADKTRLEAAAKVDAENLGTCHANVAGLGAKLDDQSKDIRDLSAASKARDDEASRRMARLELTGKAAVASSAAVLALPRPAPADACEAAARLLRGAVQ